MINIVIRASIHKVFINCGPPLKNVNYCVNKTARQRRIISRPLHKL